eukprot:Gb_19432 [translate_table: standard]
MWAQGWYDSAHLNVAEAADFTRNIREIVLKHCTPTQYFGTGLWPLLSFISHYCAPNSSVLFMGKMMFVTAARDNTVGKRSVLHWKKLEREWGEIIEPYEALCEEQGRWGFATAMAGMAKKVENKLEQVKNLNLRGEEIRGIRASFSPAYMNGVYDNYHSLPPMETILDAICSTDP